MAEKSELLQRTLDLLLLKILSLEPMHGWGITLRMEPPKVVIVLFVRILWFA